MAGLDIPGRGVLFGLEGPDRVAVEEAVVRGLDEVRAASGSVVALAGPNSSRWVASFLTLLRHGYSPLLVPGDAPAPERARLADAAGAAATVEAGRSEQPVVERSRPGGGVALPPRVLLASSGSTGAPKVVVRSIESLTAEGRRYTTFLMMRREDHVVLAAPVSHAYALGWLMGALGSDATIEPVEAARLGELRNAVCARASLVALTPAIARLLVRRGPCKGAPRSLRVAMAGAGPVDAALDDAFSASFGIRLARNYGSSETGALFAGLPPLPPGSIGGPMPEVRHRIVDEDGEEVPDGEPGMLEVACLGDGWTSMDDVVVENDGEVSMLGRRSSLARKGERWVSPLEVEAALRACRGVHDVDVTRLPGKLPEDDRLVARVVPEKGADLDAAAVFEHARRNLSAYKLPDAVEMWESISRTGAGKARPG